jgi:hypothetical protein
MEAKVLVVLPSSKVDYPCIARCKTRPDIIALFEKECAGVLLTKPKVGMRFEDSSPMGEWEILDEVTITFKK